MGTIVDLDSIMSIDHVIRVKADGSVEDMRDVYAPEVWVETDDDGQISAADDAAMVARAESEGWSVLDGWSRQYSYSGPIMHPAEYLGGALADYILETPGLWVACSVETPLDDSEGADAAGWVILHREDETDNG